ncbi:MAG: transcriptional regulator [Chthonomonadales bacterium]|nr:transcriptional regulator [Chthonomonadales bacterium]
MDPKIHEGSGNVFVDLGLPHPNDRQAKARIANYIEQLITDAKWTQTEAAQRMNLSQPDVSNIIRGRLNGFTLDRLFQCLDALDQEIEIGIQPRKTDASKEKVLVLYR